MKFIATNASGYCLNKPLDSIQKAIERNQLRKPHMYNNKQISKLAVILYAVIVRIIINKSKYTSACHRNQIS